MKTKATWGYWSAALALTATVFAATQAQAFDLPLHKRMALSNNCKDFFKSNNGLFQKAPIRENLNCKLKFRVTDAKKAPLSDVPMTLVVKSFMHKGNAMKLKRVKMIDPIVTDINGMGRATFRLLSRVDYYVISLEPHVSNTGS